MPDDASRSEAVRRACVLELHREWARLNRERLDGRLLPPLITIVRRAAQLGFWEPVTRTIGIDVGHLLEDTWLQVRLTLAHEMAHQVVSELFAAGGAPPHGELFRRACRLLGLEQSPRLQRERDPGSRRVLERIRKLLNLGRSSNPHESQAAVAAANRLLLKYNLTLTDLGDGSTLGYRWVGPALGRLPLERKLLAGLLQAHFFVRTIWVGTSRPADGKRVSVLELLGRPHNLDIAAYVHDYLEATLDRLWQDYRRQLGSTSARRERHDYRIGVLQGFAEHLEAGRNESEAEGLIWRGDPALLELLQARYPRSRALRGGYYRESDAHATGREEGRRLRIRPGLGSTARHRGRQLTGTS